MLGQMLGENKMAGSLNAYRQIFALSAGFGDVRPLLQSGLAMDALFRNGSVQ